ncbi:MAG: hypothetical protein CVU41_09310 [Chloroflexi bacterium HGW-Chloroflexi-3]|nr:MAG: hypothetical protein CVU41_09310 [Chloroflexi bacterium HGW-Chloroflexi-3]
MKRALVILLFVLMLTAAWFRWFDEIDPDTVKADLKSQATLLKEKSATFSFKEEVSQVITALDRFFSPPEEEMLVEDDLVVLLPSEAPIESVTVEEGVKTDESENTVEEFLFAPTEEFTVGDSESPIDAQETPQFSQDPNLGYPAPVVNPVVSSATEQAIVVPDQVEGEFETTNQVELLEEADVSESPIIEFNQLQETVPGSFLPYDLQSVDPLYTTNFVHPEAGCNWMGVAGQIFAENLEPKDGLVVVVEGAVNNSMIEVLGYSGLAQSYGPGGYELILSQVNSPGIFWVQLFDVQGNPLSGIYSFQMNGTCEQNLAVINFTLKSDAESKYVPTVTP